jgi:hypothetical protein
VRTFRAGNPDRFSTALDFAAPESDAVSGHHVWWSQVVGLGAAGTWAAPTHVRSMPSRASTAM